MSYDFSGKFIVLDGPDGCGKSTQAELLSGHIENTGVSVTVFRDPGTTRIGEKIRGILLDPANTGMCSRTELLLYMAARAQLWYEKIEPALQQKKCVVMDRWLSSSCAYQGFAGGLGIDNVVKIAESCLQRSWPDETIILDIDLEISSTRLGSKLDRIEQKSTQYHKKVREGFLRLADVNKEFHIIKAYGDVESVHEAVLGIFE